MPFGDENNRVRRAWAGREISKSKVQNPRKEADISPSQQLITIDFGRDSTGWVKPRPLWFQAAMAAWEVGSMTFARRQKHQISKTGPGCH
jgi:hypothetical protein